MVDIDENMLKNALNYLENVESEMNQGINSTHWSQENKLSLISYSLYVRTKFSQNVAEEVVKLLESNEFERFNLEAIGWLLFSLANDKIHKHQESIEKLYKYLKTRVNETSETANFITSYDDDGKHVMFHSLKRTDAILLEALLSVDPSSSLCIKLCKGLQASRVKGAWNSTQENCFVLVALEKYFRVKEAQLPNISADIWYDDNYCGQHQYKGE